jgi:hypothetical protein
MNIDEIKSYVDGDFAISNKYKGIYDWHLTHASESKCLFTDKSMLTAIKRNDVKLLKQLIDFGVKFIIEDDIDISDKTTILSKCNNTDIWELISTCHNKQYFISVFMMFICHRPIIKYLYDSGHMDDYNLHNLIRRVESSYVVNANKLALINNLKYISDKGYKWSIKYCQIDNIDLIKYLWRNGNNTNDIKVYDIGYNSYKLWVDLKTDDCTYYKLIKSIDPLIDKFMLDYLLEFKLPYRYTEVINYIRNDFTEYNTRCSDDGIKLFHDSIIGIIIKHYDGCFYDSRRKFKFIDRLDLLRKVKLLSLCINPPYNDHCLKLYNMYKTELDNYILF